MTWRSCSGVFGSAGVSYAKASRNACRCARISSWVSLLGGLVIKAGLAEEDTAVIFGSLIFAAEEMAGAGGEAARRRFRRAGDRVFSKDQRVQSGRPADRPQ